MYLFYEYIHFYDSISVIDCNIYKDVSIKGNVHL